MILTCQSCSTRYFADDASIGPQGRTVRCAACGHSWFVDGQLVLQTTAPEEDILKDPPPLPRRQGAAKSSLTREQVERARAGGRPDGGARAAAQVRAEQAERERRQRVRLAVGSWAGAGAAVAAIAASAVVFRQDVAQFWPQSAAAFSAVGLDVNVFGLEFTDLDVEKTFDGPTPVLVVSGAVRNIGGEAKPVPALRVSLRDGLGAEIYAHVETASGAAIAPGAAQPFRVVIENPPVQAADLEATFASAKQLAALGKAAAKEGAHADEPEDHGAHGAGGEDRSSIGGDVPLADDPPHETGGHAPADEPLAQAPLDPVMRGPTLRAVPAAHALPPARAHDEALLAPVEAPVIRAGPLRTPPEQAENILELRGPKGVG